jgi:3-(3-hydroxy-phenyl)propionate hydroxylase
MSVYRFQCRRLARFVHGRVIFAGDSAHQVSPFGARGANSGVQDAENLAWKLAMVLRQEAPERLLASYDLERGQAADENIAHSTRSTDFIAPRTAAEQRYRDAVLTLSGRSEFAKRFVNSGRLSTATVYDTPLSTRGTPHLQAAARLGAPLPDAPVGRGRFLLDLVGSGFQLLHWPDGGAVPTLPDTDTLVAGRDFGDPDGLVARRLDAAPGTTLLIRPDQHLAARWSRAGQAEIAGALARASGREAAA